MLEGLPVFFAEPPPKHVESKEKALIDKLYQQIGQLQVELEWLKKSLEGNVDQLRQAIEPEHPVLSISRQCELLGLPRSSFYDQSRYLEDPLDLTLMNRMDTLYTKDPFYGSRRMTEVLRSEGHQVNRKRIQRLMREMGLEAIYRKPKTSEAHPEHRKFPYLLRGLTIDHPNQVWSMDVTYLPMRSGFLYLEQASIVRNEEGF